jgi:hypothetical protein
MCSRALGNNPVSYEDIPTKHNLNQRVLCNQPIFKALYTMENHDVPQENFSLAFCLQYYEYTLMGYLLSSILPANNNDGSSLIGRMLHGGYYFTSFKSCFFILSFYATL